MSTPGELNILNRFALSYPEECEFETFEVVSALNTLVDEELEQDLLNDVAWMDNEGTLFFKFSPGIIISYPYLLRIRVNSISDVYEIVELKFVPPEVSPVTVVTPPTFFEPPEDKTLDLRSKELQAQSLLRLTLPEVDSTDDNYTITLTS